MNGPLRLPGFQFRLFSLLFVIGCVGVLGGLLLPWNPEPRWRFERVSVGMSHKEVRVLLGEPVARHRGKVLNVYGEQFVSDRVEYWQYPQGYVSFIEEKCVSTKMKP